MNSCDFHNALIHCDVIGAFVCASIVAIKVKGPVSSASRSVAILSIAVTPGSRLDGRKVSHSKCETW
jgi:hypothetical protein